MSTPKYSASDDETTKLAYLKVNHCLEALLKAVDAEVISSEVAILANGLYQSCPTPPSPREFIIANECVSSAQRRRLGGDSGQILLDVIEKGLEELDSAGSEELLDTFDYTAWLVFFLGLAEFDIEDRDDQITAILDRIDEWGSLNDVTTMRQAPYNVFEAAGFYLLLTCEDVPAWARLNILLVDDSTLLPDERSEIASGLISPDSFICEHLPDICADVAASPHKYEARFIDALRGFVSGDLSLASPLLEDELGISLHDVENCHHAISDRIIRDAIVALGIQ